MFFIVFDLWCSVYFLKLSGLMKLSRLWVVRIGFSVCSVVMRFVWWVFVLCVLVWLLVGYSISVCVLYCVV